MAAYKGSNREGVLLMKFALTEELIKEICSFIENGNTQKDAAALCGVAESTFYNWTKVAKEGKASGRAATLYALLLESVKKAESAFKDYHLGQIRAASTRPAHWQASAWLLERKFPNEFGRIERQPVQDKQNGQLDEMLELLKQRGMMKVGASNE